MLWTRLILITVCTLTQFLGTSGCRKEKEKPVEPNTPCAQQVADLQVWLEAMAQDYRWSGEGFYSSWGEDLSICFGKEKDEIFNVALVQVPWEAGVPPEWGYQLEIPKGMRDHVDPDFWSIKLAELQVSLKKEESDHKALSPSRTFPPRVLLVDGQAAWSLVVDIAEAVRQAGQERVQLIFLPEGGRRAKKPPPSAEYDRVAARYPRIHDCKFIIATGGEPSRFDRSFGEITKGCENLNGFRAAWKGTKPGDSDSERNFYVHCIKHLTKALAACDCKLEISALQNLLWDGPPVPVVARPVKLAKRDSTSKECTHIVAPSTATWESVVPKILAAPKDKPVCFEAKGGN